jgi:hypothetical protein
MFSALLVFSGLLMANGQLGGVGVTRAQADAMGFAGCGDQGLGFDLQPIGWADRARTRYSGWEAVCGLPADLDQAELDATLAETVGEAPLPRSTAVMGLSEAFR